MSAVRSHARGIQRSWLPKALIESGRGSESSSWDPIAVTIHDLRTPLAVIAATTELLDASAKQRGQDEDAVLLQRIQRNTTWLATLVNNLAVEIELAAFPLPLRWSAVDLQECLKSSLTIAQTHFDQRNQRVHWVRDGALKVFGDQQRIEQVLINLLMNASKYGDPHSEIRIEVEPGEEWARVQVHNFGPAIPVWEQEQIFERFARGENAISSGRPGLGLGLHIVKAIVERHGGQVGVGSSPEQGTIFWFTLPVAR